MIPSNPSPIDMVLGITEQYKNITFVGENRTDKKYMTLSYDLEQGHSDQHNGLNNQTNQVNYIYLRAR